MGISIDVAFHYSTINEKYKEIKKKIKKREISRVSSIMVYL